MKIDIYDTQEKYDILYTDPRRGKKVSTIKDYKIKIFNEDCRLTMEEMPIGCVNVIMTSPFYNTNKKQGKSRTLTNTKTNGYSYLRYDSHIDDMNDDEYCDFTENLFLEFDRILNLNGVVLYNLSYGNNNREGMFKAVNRIIENTPFTIADVITWKKSNALPNNCSPNKLTRITEFVFVFCRKEEIETFYCNKPVVSIRKTGQKSYGNLLNYVEAKNNDGPCPYNKATYSSELCEKLLKIYCPENGVVYDPFLGTGTTAVACRRLGFNCIGSEISENQCRFALNRINKEFSLDGVYAEINGNIMDL